MKRRLVEIVIGAEGINEAVEWVCKLKDAVGDCKKKLGVHGVLFSKELKSFIENPENHLRKKLFIYTHDLARGKMELAEYIRKSAAALRTSFRTNLRTAYQSWVLLEILSLMGEYGGRVVYPEYNFIPIDRTGKQRSGIIPPNVILYMPGRGYISFFVEAPRPVGWEDTSDLSRSWKLYTALRPDFMVYGGMVTNIFEETKDPPIARPDVIIECKELEDWYLRTRDIRGPFTKPLTAEEWRSKWIEGLWTGLADALGVKSPSEAKSVVEEKKTIRVKEPKLLKLYMNFYNPREMYLVSRARVPGDVKEYLERDGIVVIDDVGFDRERLRNLVEELLKYCRKGSTLKLEFSGEEARILEELTRALSSKLGRSISVKEAVILAAREVLEN